MSNQPSEISYAGRIGMSHAIDIHSVQFFTNYSRPGNALAQFEAWIEKIVQEEVEKRTLEIRCELVRAREDYLRGYALIGASDLSNFLAKCQQAKGFEERECDLECEIARLKQIISNMEEDL